MNTRMARLDLSRSALEEIALEASTLVRALGMASGKKAESRLTALRPATLPDKEASSVLLFDGIEGPLIFW